MRVDFGKVKVGSQAEASLAVLAQTTAGLSVSDVRIEGGEGTFLLTRPISQVEGLGEASVGLAFRPNAVAASAATLVLSTNDPEHPQTSVPLSGEGALPEISVVPDCDPARRCVGTVSQSPLLIDFGAEPFSRQLPLDASRLPSVVITNRGDVPLVLTGLSVAGPDAAAFTFAGNATLPPQGLTLEAGAGVNVAIRFKPSSELQVSYQAELSVRSDDPAHPEVKVSLKGTLRPNLAPTVCANLVRVVPGDGSAPLDYGSKAHWDPLLVAPPGGYDFAASRDVQPKSDVTLSAISDSADQTKCTADPEDGRIGLSYQWTVLSAPPGSTAPAIAGAANAQATLRPVATGAYVVQLLVKDVQGHETKVPLRFVVAIKEDLVVQLSWNGFPEVDLDLHLVRPTSTGADEFSGAFGFFDEGLANRTSGDINGYALIKQKNTPGFDFNWGSAGTADDPRLNVDDTGSGQLIENVSLNYPENDPLCAAGPCIYKVLVHYFRDARVHQSPAGCNVDLQQCIEGDRCDCSSAAARCVANDAPKGAPPVGTGRCLVPPEPVLRIFLKGSATPAKVIPLDDLVPPDTVAVAAPCHLLYAADVVWPRQGFDGGMGDAGFPATIVVKGADTTGRITAPRLARFGIRQANSLQCSPNTTRGVTDWYSREPLADGGR